MVPLALLVERLSQVGLTDDASELAQHLATLEGLESGLQLWVIDALRIAGDPAEALRRERALLALGRLHPERIAEVLSAIQAEEGPEAMLAAAAPITEYNRDPSVMELLLAAHKAQGDEAAATLWSDRQAAARTAEEALAAR